MNASHKGVVRTIAVNAWAAALGACFQSLRDHEIGGFILLRNGKRAWRLRRC
jgi:hypothetical protein